MIRHGLDNNSTGSVAPVIHLPFQYRQLETILACAYGGACFFAFWAFTMHYQSPSRQVATLGFYLLMSLAALTRTIWFASSYSVFSITLEPPLLSRGNDGWEEFFIYEATEMLGSYFLYSIFILIVVFWADMLRRLFTQNNVQSNPLRRFFIILSLVFSVQAIGLALFLMKRGNSYWLMLYDDILLALISFASLVAITIYSFRMKTVLQAFLEVSQIDTTDRIKAVNWATSICCLFLLSNLLFLCYSLISIVEFNQANALFSSNSWWIIMTSKHSLEIISLYFLLYSLWGKNADETQRKDGYEPIPDLLSDEETHRNIKLV